MLPLLITAGATRNPVDAIRYLSAHATGTTGVELADRLQGRFNVQLLGSTEAVLRAQLATPSLSTEAFTSTRDLMARMETALRARPGGVLIHSAAVGDYEMAPSTSKIPSNQPEMVLRFTPGPKIVDHVRSWDPTVFLVSFKAGNPEWDEVRLEAVARAQLERTGSDLVFANRLGALGTSCLLVDRRSTVAFSERTAALEALVARIIQARG